MKPLIDLTLEEYKREINSGMFWEVYPEATGSFSKDCFGAKERRKKMLKQETEQYGTRTLCSILKNMRTLDKTKNYSYLSGLIEEAQYRAERMENALEAYGEDWDGLRAMEKERIKLKKEIKLLKKEKEKLEEEKG